jgi:hypothetical protein
LLQAGNAGFRKITKKESADDIEAGGGKALAVVCDIRFEEQIQQAVKEPYRLVAASISW